MTVRPFYDEEESNADQHQAYTLIPLCYYAMTIEMIENHS